MLNFATIYEAAPINDNELDALAVCNPALYFRRMWGYLKSGLGRITTPPIAATWCNDFVPPQFGDNRLIADGISNTWNTGLFNFDIAIVTQLDNDGNTISFPPFQYDPLTGIVIFDETPLIGNILSIDAYKDGWFNIPENFEFINNFVSILGIAMLDSWELRFTGSALDRRGKVKDRTFDFPNEANWIDKNNNRLITISARLNEEMIRFEQLMELR